MGTLRACQDTQSSEAWPEPRHISSCECPLYHERCCKPSVAAMAEQRRFNVNRDVDCKTRSQRDEVTRLPTFAQLLTWWLRHPERNGSSPWRRTLSHDVRSRSAVGHVHPYLYRHSNSSRLDYRDTNRRRWLCDHLEHRSRRAVCSIVALIDPYRSTSTQFARHQRQRLRLAILGVPHPIAGPS
jgi:hypothetical protein